MSRLVFACGTPHGGALESTLALARLEAAAGREVIVVVATDDPYGRLPTLTGFLVRVRTRSPRLGAVLWWLHDVVSGRGAAIAEHGVSVHRVSDVPAAVRRLLRRGDVVVMNSMRLLDLRRTARFAAAASAEVVWYLREAAALDHAATLVGSVDRVLANSRPLAERYTSITALPCAYVPSVIDVDPLVAPSGEGCILLVNAVPSYGQAEAIAIAAAMPHRHVVLQESWPIGPEALEALRRAIAPFPNIEFRHRMPRERVYADAAVMIAPHSADAVGLNRPRVALEAQVLGVPMVAHDVPGLASVAASRELLVPVGAGIDAWVERIDAVASDPARFSAAATEFARRELIDAEELVELFESAIGLRAAPVDPSSLPGYSAVVATFGRVASLCDCLRVLVAQSVAPGRIVVVDNDPAAVEGGSTEVAVRAAVSASGVPLTYVAPGENLGPSGGWALGAERMVGSAERGEWLMLIDDDDPMGSPQVAAELLGVAAQSGRRVVAVGRRGAVVRRCTGLLRRVRPVAGGIVDAQYLAGGGTPIYRWEMIDREGFVDPHLFFGFEDLDLGLRWTTRGGRLVVHESPTASSPADTASGRSPWREYYKTRAIVVVCRRHLGAAALVSTLLRTLVLGGVRVVVQTRGTECLRARWAGAFDGLRGRLGERGRAPSLNPPKSPA